MKVLEILAGSPVSRAAAKRDTVLKRLSDAQAKHATLTADVEAARTALRDAVGDEGSDPEKLASKLAKLRMDLAAAEELVEALTVAARAADEGFADVERRERLRIIETAAAEAGKAWLAARADIVGATFSLAEARGREADLARRIERLGDQAAQLGGRVTFPEVAKRLEDEVADAVWQKYGGQARKFDFDVTPETRPYLMTVHGLAGPEPEVP